uniref:Uncharacterized mitochondrial protein AtMg00810-like n=1 Tax=Nicotiana tabacum TaxID=4097 RepID=A0A1S3ZHN0_TOBAC|nr:PREDICTED: uncharacterized mitochondrial protein AtMg00810-like [Nicotiana tabacum]
MNRRKYAMKLISESGLGGAKPVGTPLELNQKLTSTEYDSWMKINAEDEMLRDPMQVLSQFMHCPKVSHMEAALRVVRYIKAEPGLGLLMPDDNTNKLTTYCDSDWGACLQTRRLVIGYLVKFGNALISWKSKKQDTVSRSSVEAEFRSMATCATEVTWLIRLFEEFGVKLELPVNLLCDSKAAIQIATNPIFHERTTHIHIDYIL